MLIDDIEEGMLFYTPLIGAMKLSKYFERRLIIFEGIEKEHSSLLLLRSVNKKVNYITPTISLRWMVRFV